MIIRNKAIPILASISLAAVLWTSPALALKYKLNNVFVTSYSISASELAKRLERKLPKNVSPSELKAMKRDLAGIARKASSRLKSRSANGTKNVEISICGRRVCVTIRFRRRNA